MKGNSSRWSTALALSLLVAGSLPALALPDTSVRQMTADAPTVAQVSSISELTDVDPNSWAFQALKSLVERYGCIEGYPSKVFLGNKSTTRYEFAAGLNACLEKINELIEAGTGTLATKDDLAAIQRLQDQFKADLAALKGRVTNLEAKTQELESQQFSKTAKLDAEFITSIIGAGAGEVVDTNTKTPAGNIGGSSQNVAWGYRARLNIRANNIAVKGDQLRVRIDGRSGEGSFFGGGNIRVARYDYLNPQGAPTTINGASTLAFDKVYYTLPIFNNKDLKFTIGPAVESLDYLGTNSNTSNEGVNFSLRAFRRNLPVSLVAAPVPGAALVWKLNDVFTLKSYYGASAGGQSYGYGSGGVTGGANQFAGELGIKPFAGLDIGLGYWHTTCGSFNPVNPEIGSTVANANAFNNRVFCNSSVGGSTRDPIASSTFNNVVHDSYNVHADWDIIPEVSLFGRYTFGNAQLNPLPASASKAANLDYNEWMAGLTFKNPFGQKGNAIGLAVVQPSNITRNSNPGSFASGTFPSGSGIPNATEYDYGIYYRFNIVKGITLTPEVYFITGAGSIANQPTITVGDVRATFTF